MNISSFINKQTFLSCICCWSIPLAIAFFYFILAASPDLRLAVPLLTGITSIQVILIATALYLGELNVIQWSPGFIMVLAVLFRILFLFKAPQLSDDVYRYLWDGLQTLSGNNPYTLPPDTARAFTDAMILLRQKVNHSDLVTIYPPASQFIFAVGAFLGKNIFGIKALIVLMDLLTCFLIIRLLSALNIKPYKAVLYAWHPLPVIEIAYSGHIDGAGFLFLFSAILLFFLKPGSKFFFKRKNETCDLSFIPHLAAGFLFSFSVLIKYFPLIFLPGLMIPGRIRNKAAFLTGFFTGIFFLSLPFMPGLKNSFFSLNTYLYNWEFAGFIFRSLRGMIITPEMPRKILLITFITITGVLYSRLFYCSWFSMKPVNEPASLSSLLKTFYLISFVFLLLTPTLHPWYAICLLSFLPFTAGPAGLVFSWSVFLGYRVLIPYTILGHWTENTTTAFMIWIAPVIAFIASSIANTKRPCRLLSILKHIDHS